MFKGESVTHKYSSCWKKRIILQLLLLVGGINKGQKGSLILIVMVKCHLHEMLLPKLLYEHA